MRLPHIAAQWVVLGMLTRDTKQTRFSVGHESPHLHSCEVDEKQPSMRCQKPDHRRKDAHGRWDPRFGGKDSTAFDIRVRANLLSTGMNVQLREH